MVKKWDRTDLDDFVKFPSTPHLAVLPGVTVREDKVLSDRERNAFLAHALTVEEKIDGANLGLSFDHNGDFHAQNRGGHIQTPYTGQWKKLTEWLAPRLDTFFEVLADRYILFGEWCYAKHSVTYTQLPDWFLGFDIFDKRVQNFLDVKKRNEIFASLAVLSVPLLKTGIFSLSALEEIFTRSWFGDSPAEGIYLRYDKEGWLQGRCKLVRPSFVQSVEEHWSRSAITPNRLGVLHAS